MQEYAMFLGCTVPVRGIGYDVSTRRIAEAFDAKLTDIEGFDCCGYPLLAVDHLTGLAMAAKNLAHAEEKGLDMMTVCSACYGTLTKVDHALREDDKEREAVNKVLSKQGLEFKGGTKIKHFSRWLHDEVGIEAIKERVTTDISGLKVAPHYGCHYMKPTTVFEDGESGIRPQTLDNLISAAGATPIDYMNKLRCCGGGTLAVREETSIKMVKAKLDDIKKTEANAITLHCPFCSIMYDEYQPSIEDRFETTYKLPVLFYPQLLGLAMGMHWKKDLAINKNNVKAKKLLRGLGVIE